MDLDTLSGIAQLMEKYNLSHVETQIDGEKIKLDRAVPAAPQPPFAGQPGPAAWTMGQTRGTETPVAQAQVAQAPGSQQESAAQPAAPAQTPSPSFVASPADGASSDIFDVEAPMVGVFYAAPAPGADPFVHVGSKVKKGDTLCIVEAMKCMNEVQSEVDGTVVDICANDGELVEYGRCLMRIS